MKSSLLGLIVAMIGGMFSSWQKKEEPDFDQQVLDQLKKAGSDLSKPHKIEFYLYFPTNKTSPIRPPKMSKSRWMM